MRDSQLRASARLNGWGVYAAILLLLSAVVQAGTYVGRTFSSNAPLLIGLHIGIFPVFMALVLRWRGWQRERKGPFGMYYRRLDWRGPASGGHSFRLGRPAS